MSLNSGKSLHSYADLLLTIAQRAGVPVQRVGHASLNRGPLNI